MGKSKAATEFPNFSKLPLELRREVWRFAACIPRVIEVRTRPASLSWATTASPAPAVLHVNQEARREALRVLTLLELDPIAPNLRTYASRILPGGMRQLVYTQFTVATAFRPFRTYINFEQDTICVTFDNSDPENSKDYRAWGFGMAERPYSFLWYLRASEYGLRVRTLALGFELPCLWMERWRHLYGLLLTWYGLKTVTFTKLRRPLGGKADLIKTLKPLDIDIPILKLLPRVRRKDLSKFFPLRTKELKSLGLDPKTPIPKVIVAECERYGDYTRRTLRSCSPTLKVSLFKYWCFQQRKYGRRVNIKNGTSSDAVRANARERKED